MKYRILTIHLLSLNVNDTIYPKQTVYDKEICKIITVKSCAHDGVLLRENIYLNIIHLNKPPVKFKRKLQLKIIPIIYSMIDPISIESSIKQI